MNYVSTQFVFNCDFHEIVQIRLEEGKGSILKHDFKIHNHVDVIFIYDGYTATATQTNFCNN